MTKIIQNKRFTAIESDIVTISTEIEQGSIDATQPHCFVGAQFFADAEGEVRAFPDAGQIAITIQTYNSAPMFENVPVGVIPASNTETLSWAANTAVVKAVPSDITVATHYKIVVTCNES